MIRFPWSPWTPWGPQTWDVGVNGRTIQVAAPTDWLISAADVNEKVLRNVNDGADDEHVMSLIKTAIRAAEQENQTAIVPATYAWVGDGFPTESIELQMNPVRDIVSLAYVDDAGDSQTLSVSPEDYLFQPSGYLGAKAVLRPLYGASWPSTRSQSGAVQVTYTAGYLTQDEIPSDVLHGIYLMVGEMYKTRGLSIQPQSNSIAAPLQLNRFWRKYR